MNILVTCSIEKKIEIANSGYLLKHSMSFYFVFPHNQQAINLVSQWSHFNCWQITTHQVVQRNRLLPFSFLVFCPTYILKGEMIIGITLFQRRKTNDFDFSFKEYVVVSEIHTSTHIQIHVFFCSSLQQDIHCCMKSISWEWSE